jgi:hypothetical protein
MRLWLIVDSVVVFIAGVQLFILTDYTNLFFAWTITPALTATFLGSGYWASLPLVYFSSRQTTWARARLAVFGIFVFSVLTLAATLLHIDRFHLASADTSASIAAWAWLIIYLIFPPLLLGLLIFQLHLSGLEPSRETSLPFWLRLVLAGQAAVMLILGAILFSAPTTPLWPWLLTPLTGRAIAAWLIGIGIIAAQTSWENDWRRVEAGLLSYALFGGLQLLALIRYSATIDWRAPQTLIYLFFLVSMLIVGSYGWLKARRADGLSGKNRGIKETGKT